MRLTIQFMVGWALAFGTVWQAGAQTPAPAKVVCPPATVTWFEGTGPARSGILLRWDTRVVGGGVVRADGRWRMQVQPSADQASGNYAVVVEQRGTGVQLGAWTCVVENTSLPTPGVQQTTEPSTATTTATETAPTADAAPATAARTPTSSTVPGRTATAQPTNAGNDENSPIVQPTTTTTTATSTTRTATPGTATATTATATPGTATSTTATSTTASPTSTANDVGDEAQCTVCIVSAEPSVDDAPAYLVISNDGGSAVDLTGWTVRINGGASFTLPQYVLQPDDNLTIILAAADEEEEGVIYWPDATMAASAMLELANRSGAAQSTYRLDRD